MAERRMFAKTIIDSDVFLDMPLSTQALYFHLSMRADDEGFVNNPKKIQRMIGASDDDMKVLVAKSFLLTFESGVIVIKHWKIHNYIRGDRLQVTAYQDEKALLDVDSNGAYSLREDIKVIEDMDADDKRKLAYKESTLPYSFTYKMRRAFEGRPCPICGKKMTSSYTVSKPTIQHNIPISKGGKHELDNISIICESCNTSIRDNETNSLNNEEVIKVWDDITYAESHGINWFWSPNKLSEIRCQTNDRQMSDTCPSNVGIGKDSIDKDSIDKESKSDKPTTPTKKKYGQYKHVLLTDDEYTKLHADFTNADEAITFLDEYIEMKGYKAKSHYLCIRKWVIDALKERETKKQRSSGVTKSAQAYNSYQQRNYSSQDMNDIEAMLLAKSREKAGRV